MQWSRLYCVIMYASHGTTARTRVTGHDDSEVKWVHVETFLLCWTLHDRGIKLGSSSGVGVMIQREEVLQKRNVPSTDSKTHVRLLKSLSSALVTLHEEMKQ